MASRSASVRVSPVRCQRSAPRSKSVVATPTPVPSRAAARTLRPSGTTSLPMPSPGITASSMVCVMAPPYGRGHHARRAARIVAVRAVQPIRRPSGPSDPHSGSAVRRRERRGDGARPGRRAPRGSHGGGHGAGGRAGRTPARPARPGRAPRPGSVRRFPGQVGPAPDNEPFSPDPRTGQDRCDGAEGPGSVQGDAVPGASHPLRAHSSRSTAPIPGL